MGKRSFSHVIPSGGVALAMARTMARAALGRAGLSEVSLEQEDLGAGRVRLTAEVAGRPAQLDTFGARLDELMAQRLGRDDGDGF